ncbi:MAG: hypothetical protein AAB612_02100 [Patescibacteria group bacterium]
MALPNFLGGKKSPDKRMLALDIGSEVVTASVWSAVGGHVKVLKISSAIEWQEGRLEELAEAADVALEELGKDATEIDEVILGLQEDWIEQDHVITAKKPLLKNLSDQLKLKPVGFVVTHEALVAYLRELEGSPLNAVCIESTTAQLSVFVVKVGVKSATITVGRSENISADLSEAFSRMKLDAYSSRIILFGARAKPEELDQEKQHVLAFDWKKSFPFLHIPKVETLPHNILSTAICVAGGAEIARAGAVENLEQESEQEKMNSGTHTGVKEKDHHSAEDLGFHELEVEDLSKSADASEKKNESFGVMEPMAPLEPPTPPTPPNPHTEPRKEFESNVIPVPMEKKPFSIFLPKFPPIFKNFSKFFSNIFAGRTLNEKFSSQVSGAKQVRIAIAVILLILVVAIGTGTFFLWSTAYANVIITIKTAPISQDIQLTLDPTAQQSNPTAGILKVENVEKEVTGELEDNTTGTNIVGDKAKGKVTIYNATTGDKKLPAGTVFTAPNNLKFTLDTEVIVASSSGTAESAKAGTADVAVTAVNIGTESNIGAKTKFTVANFDQGSYVAINNDTLSGGSSREIQAVSKDDYTRLENVLTKQLQQQALAALNTDLQQDARIIPIGSVTVKSKTYTAKIGDEATTLKLTMTMTATALRYKTSDLVSVATTMLQSSMTDGAILREEKTQIDPGEVQQTPTTGIQLKATLSSEIIPAVDKQKLAELIVGKTIPQALSILKEQKEVGSAEITVSPRLAQIIFTAIPKDIDRIAIQTKVGSQ